MHIAIDSTPLSSAHAARGVGVYTKHLIESLQQYETDHSYTLFTRVQKVPGNVDLVHYPYFDPYFLTLPLSKPKPVVVTVHDLIPLVFPNQFPSGVRGQMKWQIQKISLLGTKRIITDSRNSKKDIMKITNFLQDAIDVIPLAADPVFQKPSDTGIFQKIQKAYTISNKYIVYVGDVNWNKNVLGLLGAFHRLLKDSSCSDIRLVCIGKSFLDNTLEEVKHIKKLIHTLQLEKSVVFTGFVSDIDLAAIYKSALCSIQPSLYEGFGLPVLEAMVSGCPVVCSNASSLPEIMGPSISIVPDSTESIVAGLRKCIGLSGKERSIIIEKGISYSRNFTWKRVARETVEAYERTLA